jgi:hypothetical protein
MLTGLVVHRLIEKPLLGIFGSRKFGSRKTGKVATTPGEPAPV